MLGGTLKHFKHFGELYMGREDCSFVCLFSEMVGTFPIFCLGVIIVAGLNFDNLMSTSLVSVNLMVKGNGNRASSMSLGAFRLRNMYRPNRNPFITIFV